MTARARRVDLRAATSSWEGSHLQIVIALGPFRLGLLGVSAVLSVVSFALYGWDKAAARRGARRTPELVLHLASVAGGWPGALLGQRVFRHKTRKQPFRTIFWCTVVINGLAVVWALAALPAA